MVIRKERGGSGVIVSFYRFLDNKGEGVVGFGLVVESTFEKIVVAFFIDINQVGIGTRNSSSTVFVGN